MKMKKNKIKPKKYVLQILQLYPQISSGRKNIQHYEERLQKNLFLTKSYLKKIKYESRK